VAVLSPRRREPLLPQGRQHVGAIQPRKLGRLQACAAAATLATTAITAALIAATTSVAAAFVAGSQRGASAWMTRHAAITLNAHATFMALRSHHLRRDAGGWALSSHHLRRDGGLGASLLLVLQESLLCVFMRGNLLDVLFLLEPAHKLQAEGGKELAQLPR